MGGGKGRGCDGMAALCFLCRSLLFFRARKMGLCNSHVISPEIVVGLQLLPLLLQLGSLAFGSSQTDTLRSAPASSENNFCSVLHTDTRTLCTMHATKGDAPACTHARVSAGPHVVDVRAKALIKERAGKLARTIKLFDQKRKKQAG